MKKIKVESSRSAALGTEGDIREQELSDVTGTPRRSDTVQQGVAAAVSFTIARAPATSVQGWQEGNQGELLGLILAELQDARQRQTAVMTCLEQRLESFTMDQATLRGELLQGQTAMEAQMLHQTSALCDEKDSLAQLQQRLDKMQQQAEAMVIVHESLEKRMESIVDGIAQQAEGIEQQADGFAQQARESNAQTLDKLVALDSKIDKARACARAAS